MKYTFKSNAVIYFDGKREKIQQLIAANFIEIFAIIVL